MGNAGSICRLQIISRAMALILMEEGMMGGFLEWLNLLRHDVYMLTCNRLTHWLILVYGKLCTLVCWQKQKIFFWKQLSDGYLSCKMDWKKLCSIQQTMTMTRPDQDQDQVQPSEGPLHYLKHVLQMSHAWQSPVRITSLWAVFPPLSVLLWNRQCFLRCNAMS